MDNPYLLEATFTLQAPQHPERDRHFDPSLHLFVRESDSFHPCRIKLLLSEDYFKYYSPREIVDLLSTEELASVFAVLTQGKSVHQYTQPMRAFFDVGKSQTLAATKDLVEMQVRAMTKEEEDQGDTFLLLRNIRQSLYDRGILTE